MPGRAVVRSDQQLRVVRQRLQQAFLRSYLMNWEQVAASEPVRASHATGPPSRRRRFGASAVAFAEAEASRRRGERGRV
jgi:hypothetical protein